MKTTKGTQLRPPRQGQFRFSWLLLILLILVALAALALPGHALAATQTGGASSVFPHSTGATEPRSATRSEHSAVRDGSLRSRLSLEN